jgi:hypothetical protein
MSDDVFNSSTGETQDPVNPLDALVGPGKKFETIEDLAKGKLEADLHIQKLEGEAQLTREQLTELKQKAEKNVTLTEMLDQFKKAQKGSEADGTTPLTEEALKQLVKQVMEGETEAQTRADNRRAANQAVLQKLNGDVEAARAYVAEMAKKHGMTVEQAQALGESSPSAFRTIMGIDQKVPVHTGEAGVSSIPAHSAPLSKADVVDGHRTKAYYDRVKKEMGAAAYWKDQRLQKQYYADAFALGERFNKPI